MTTSTETHSPSHTGQTAVPRLSMAALHQPDSQTAFVRDLWQALSEFGFVVISDHGIAPSVFSQAYDYASRLFALPLATKQAYETGHGQRGYIAFGKETAKGSAHPDLKEFWHIGPEQSANPDGALPAFPDNLWPDRELPGFRPFFQGLHHALNQVALTLLQALAQAMELPADYFGQLIKDGNSVQRLIHYPPLTDMDRSGSIRAAAHADINLMTLLVGATHSGLELLNKQGHWLPVESEANDLVVDTGDMMALLTNNRLPATIHRVVNPVDPSQPRYSIPFFVHPKNSALLAPLPQFVNTQTPAQFQTITAGDYLAQRLKENGF